MEELTEEKRKTMLNEMLKENLIPQSIMDSINKSDPEGAKDLARASIDSALENLYYKTRINKGFHVTSQEFMQFYRERYPSLPEVVSEMDEHLSHKMQIGETTPLFKWEEKKEEVEDPNTILSRIFVRTLSKEEIKKKFSTMNNYGFDEKYVSELKTNIIKSLNEEAPNFAKTGDFRINTDILNFYLQNNIPGLRDHIRSKLNFDDRVQDISKINGMIESIAMKPKTEEVEKKEVKPLFEEKQPAKKEEEKGFGLSDLGLAEKEAPIEGILGVESAAKKPGPEKRVEQAKEEKPSMRLFVKTFFTFQNGKPIVRSDLVDSQGNKAEGMGLYEMAKSFLNNYSTYHGIENKNQKVAELQREESVRKFIMSEHRILMNIIKELRTNNEENTPDPKLLERYSYISLALNLLHTKLSEITNRFADQESTYGNKVTRI